VLTGPTKRHSTVALLALLVQSLYGCVNQFEEHYRPIDPRAAEQIGPITGGRHCDVIAALDASDAAAMEKSLGSSGYACIGTSSFEERGAGDLSAQAQAQGARVGADVVVLANEQAGDGSIAIAIEYPQTQQEIEQCKLLPQKFAHTLLGRKIYEGCPRMVTRTPVPVQWRRYSATYWRKVSTSYPADAEGSRALESKPPQQ